MLELLISLRRTQGEGQIGGAEKDDKKVGDVIVAKKSPATWGEMERQYFLIAYLDWDELEAEMDETSVQVHPFARYDEVVLGEDSASLVCQRRSSYQVDIEMFSGSPGLDPAVSSGAVAPNEGDNLLLPDLLLWGPTPEEPADAILLDSTGLNSAVAATRLADRLSVVEHLVFVYNEKIWRHDLDVPDGHYAVDISDTISGIMEFPQPSQLVDKGKPRADELGVTYVVYGREENLPGALRYALRKNVVLVNPVWGWTDEQIETEAAAQSIDYELLEYEVDGQPVTHRRVLT